MLDSAMQQALRASGLAAPLPPPRKKKTSVNPAVKPYRYRGLPCTIAAPSERWCVAGLDELNGGGGILEWCINESDAQSMLAQMREFPQFKHLTAHRYSQ